ncbi:response regulator [Flavobacterium johnsoniae]|jgi:response regulator RpfG family c-di-GMP phosphodiesterase|uniref:CheY chemotaxis protein or a CheY-like REC (Receiver) domain n=2 Tax=Flavobacterium johnsoniae TaxID=986 RepID=A0A1M5KBZ0_FLAJO|nr:response regulator [Flavobacterium johnsoniae]ABQ03071.1 response regulator receiver protein [Flavobacterium johnsoniae UW101]OXG01490.1 response regulator [Flavobacterium johnsoniae UW101]WQG80067.1 response regulator [Flavobacterium johnsoniae UW101]SHG50211.1 CheY chemotaxis protein or a CheY-like REC (receiver) domain [Flavobacterium johnsoniae]SHL86063.1 CheY chemotaxis protein or a CheY-like REC (receiver) domain [Flavobacterium johnsoniae]
MFKKVLVAEDLDSISIAVVQVLEDLNIPVIDHVKYCDEGLLKVKKALNEKEPYDLLITDLSFKTDHRKANIESGDELIEAINKVQPELKKIVFSIEDKSYRIKTLFDELGINAYVSKGRNSIQELRSALEKTFKNEERILSSDLNFSFNDKSLIEIESYDISILSLLAKGYILENISNEFKEKSITPNGTSSIEKRINKLKIYFKANNNVHLIAIAKDFGLV